MKNGVFLQKLEILEETLIELRSLGTLTAEILTDWKTKKAVERNLQILIEIVIDICQRILSTENQSPAGTGAQAVDRCMELGFLTRNEAYGQMVRFRNLIVHRYEKIQSDIIINIVNNHLADLDFFREDVLRYVKNP